MVVGVCLMLIGGLNYYKQGLLLRRIVGDRAGEARILTSIAMVYNQRGENQTALAYYSQALPLEHAVGDRSGEARTLNNIGKVHDALGEKQTALDYFNQALPLERAVGDRIGEAGTLTNIGVVYMNLGELQTALECYHEALSLELAAGDRSDEAATLSNMGRLYDALGETQKALDYYDQALPLERAVGDRAAEATTLSDIGGIYDQLGEEQKALDYDNQALPLQHAVGDRAGEAETLSNIGVIYSDLGDRQKALAYYNQALPLQRAAGDRGNEGRTLTYIGGVYFALGERQKALDYYNQALPLNRAAGDRAGEAYTLSNSGVVYNDLGEKQKALDYFNQALSLERAVGDRADEATTLGHIGLVYINLGEIQKGLDYYNAALPLERAVGNRAGEAITLASIGGVYDLLGERQKALDYDNQALPLERAVGDRAAEATTLSNIGGVYDQLGEKPKALDYDNQALPLQRAVGDRAGEAATLNNIGAVYDQFGEKQKALDYVNQALPLNRAVGDRAGEATTLMNIGVVYDQLGEKPKALDYFTQSLPLFRAVRDPLGEGSALLNMMEYWKSLQNPSLAVLFGKQAIDRIQQVRRNIGGLERQTQQTFLKSWEYYYRELAELLISGGRLPEAQQVLDLLKAEEYSEFTQRRGDKPSTTSPPALTPAEEKSTKDYDQITGEITAIGEEWTQLQAKSSRSADEAHRYNELSDSLTAVNQRFQAFLKTLFDTFGKDEHEGPTTQKMKDDLKHDANVKVETINGRIAGLKTLVGELDPGTVAVYTLVLDQKVVMMVITPAIRVAREIPIGKIALRNKVGAFVWALAHHFSEEDILPKAQDLYNVLIAPIEKDLQGAHAKTLIWSLDDTLHYLPLAALYDGHQYLLERYRNVVITIASIEDLKDQPHVGSGRGVAMGVSKDYDGGGKLNTVPEELNAVVRSDKTPGSHGPVPGTILLDDAFTETGMETALDQHPLLVHIASHYVFNPAGDDTKSYLLLGGKESGGRGFHLTLAELRDDQRMDFRGVELLTLAGCETALGSIRESDGREIDGLGITAQQKGAKAVMATLWKVDDASVGILMATFYQLWVKTPGMTKAEALQQAQLALLHGTADTAGASQASEPAASPANALKLPLASPYANPFYWAPFILIGNWK
jgi:CHAT domain-containing protein/tetratricopeptide (TPR) repeat protein